MLRSRRHVLGLLALTLSTALNFGPQHSLAWRTPPVEAAVAADLAARPTLPDPRRSTRAVGEAVCDRLS